MYSSKQKQKRLNKLILNEKLKSSEQMRMIRTGLEAVTEKDHPLIMVTSPNTVKQKEWISAKLAISLCEQGKNVLLVDANLRQPTLHDLFFTENLSGLTNLVLEGGSLEQYVKECFVKGLKILPTGPILNEGLDLIVINQIHEVLEEWKQQFDVIIIESPDLLNVADAQIMARHCDGVILVAKAKKTKKEELLHAKKYLDRAYINILGVIFQTR